MKESLITRQDDSSSSSIWIHGKLARTEVWRAFVHTGQKGVIVVKYLINVRETSERVVEVEADSVIEAEKMVERHWKDGDIVLSAEDFKGVEVSLFQDNGLV